MKSIRFILVALIGSLMLAACERPAPEGEIPPPVENSTEIVPRTDEVNPPAATDGTVTAPIVSPDTAVTDPANPITETQTIENPETSPAATPTTGETTDQPPLEDGVYIVRAGDSLGQIAFVYGITVEDIMAANNLTNPDTLDVGQELIIPDAGFADTPPADTTPPAENPPAETGTEQTHIVQAGDNLYRIGLRYGFTVDELAEYNGLTDVNNLEVGQEIKIPPSN